MKQITMRMIADEAQVSLSTVSRVINRNGYVAEDKKKRVQSVLDKYEYELPELPGAKGGPSPDLIALIYPVSEFLGVPNFFSQMVNYITTEAIDYDYHPILFPTGQLTNDVLSQIIVRVLKLKRVKGLVILGPYMEEPDFALSKLLTMCEFPIIKMGFENSKKLFDTIVLDSSRGIHAATEYLIEQGCTNLVYIDKPGPANSISSERLAGFIEAIKSHPSVTGHTYVPDFPDGEIHSNPLVGIEIMKRVLAGYPNIDGVVNYSDYYLPGEISHYYGNFSKLPHAIRFVGHDNTLAPYMTPPIPSVRFPYEDCTKCIFTLINSWFKSTSILSRTMTISTTFVIPPSAE